MSSLAHGPQPPKRTENNTSTMYNVCAALTDTEPFRLCSSRNYQAPPAVMPNTPSPSCSRATSLYPLAAGQRV